MKPRRIRTAAEYEAAIARLEDLMLRNPGAGSAESQEIRALVPVIKRYESETVQWPIPDPIDTILMTLKQRRLTRRDLIPFIGSEARVSEVLNRKRPLTLAMIRRLRDGLQIPADQLINPIVLKR